MVRLVHGSGHSHYLPGATLGILHADEEDRGPRRSRRPRREHLTVFAEFEDVLRQAGKPLSVHEIWQALQRRQSSYTRVQSVRTALALMVRRGLLVRRFVPRNGDHSAPRVLLALPSWPAS